MTWFNIIKNKDWLNKDWLEENEDWHEQQERHKKNIKLYGMKGPYRFLGELKPINDLRGDYSHILELVSKYRGNTYNISTQKFEQGIAVIFKLGMYFVQSSDYISIKNINLQFYINSGSLEPVSFTTKLQWDDNFGKYIKDFVEIYNQPNHQYKSIKAELKVGVISTISQTDELIKYIIENINEFNPNKPHRKSHGGLRWKIILEEEHILFFKYLKGLLL
tara:strand:- start:201 stop:860 length:660 start_codon:yes stop_codon:yes gene_type:complete